MLLFYVNLCTDIYMNNAVTPIQENDQTIISNPKLYCDGRIALTSSKCQCSTLPASNVYMNFVSFSIMYPCTNTSVWFAFGLTVARTYPSLRFAYFDPPPTLNCYIQPLAHVLTLTPQTCSTYDPGNLTLRRTNTKLINHEPKSIIRRTVCLNHRYL